MNGYVKKIGIIGAGVSGLVAAKTFIEEGFDCEVFEREKSLGGVWENGYHSLHLQLPKESYELLDWPMPLSYPRFPSCDQILSYLNSFARQYQVYQRVRFNCCVTKIIRRIDNGGWRLCYVEKNSDEENQKEFDFIVICNGLYSTPRLPDYPSRDRFRGHVLHSSRFRDPELAKGRSVVVVGFGKSALDTAENAAHLTNQVTLVFRRAHWPLPRRFLGLLDIKFISSRFVSAMLPLYQHPGKWERRLHTYGSWIVWCFWRTMEFVLRAQFRLKATSTLPTAPIEQDLFTGDFIASGKIYSLIRQGRIKIQQSTIKQFNADGVDLANGARVRADTVVFATGWRYDLSFLPHEYESLIEEDGLYLYRHILHPDMPGLAFVGLASTFNNSLSDYLEARWLVGVLKDDITLPDREALRQEIEHMKRWKRGIMPPQSNRAALIQPHGLHYHDELLRDMQVENRRKRNFIAELFGAYEPADYQGVLYIYPHKHGFPKFNVPGKKYIYAQMRAPRTADDRADGGEVRVVDWHAKGLDESDLRACNLSGLDLSQADFEAVDLRRARLYRSNLSGANLEGANISGADLRSAELINANLSGATLNKVNLESSFLIDAKLANAYLNGANLSGAHLSGARLNGAHLSGAQLRGADLTGADLTGADLRGANCEGCDLSNCTLKQAKLNGANLSGAILLSADFGGADITGVKFNETETCKDIRINSAYGNALFKRFAQDQAYIEEYKVHRPVRYCLWKYSSNCGRSLGLWVLWCIVIAIGFGLIFHYHLGGSESFILTELAKDPNYDAESWAPMLYYSVVTFTTLGFGDIVPRTQEAAWWVMAEVVMGYFMLGGLITILATKLARRS